MKNLVVAVGGTGGHVYPAIALCEYVRANLADVKPRIMGKKGGQEESIAADYGLQFDAVRVVKMPAKKLSPAVLGFAVNLAMSVLSGWKTLGAVRPVAVVGFGGFASFPTVVSAWLRGIPVYLHEQNAMMGLVNRTMARLAKKVFLSFEKTDGVPQSKVVFTGNPSRYEGLELPDARTARAKLGLDPERLTVMVTGGSQGARSVNRAVYDWVKANASRADVQVLHLTGRANFEEAKTAYGEIASSGAAIRTEPRDYLKEMHLAYSAADVVLCRAGATTMTEIASTGKPAILVPYPFAAGNHQELNARRAVESGAAMMILDKDLNLETLSGALAKLIGDKSELVKMSERAKSLYRPGAAKLMTEVIAGNIR